MTLEEFSDKLLSMDSSAVPTSIYVFEDESSMDNWTTERRCNVTTNVRDYYLSCVIHGDAAANYYLNKRFCEAEVEYFYAVEPDLVAVYIHTKKEA